MTPRLINQEMILSIIVQMISTLRNEVQMLLPAAIMTAEIRDVPEPVTPPNTYTTGGAEAIVDAAAWITVANKPFFQSVNQPALAMKPVIKPTMTFT